MARILVELLGDQVEQIISVIGDDVVTDEAEQRERELLNRRDIGETQKLQLVKARRGQGLFRARVEIRERGSRVTGVEEKPLLRASHIKPWRDCTDTEKLDGNNGLLLAPHVDHLFDRGFISFSMEGDVLVSSRLREKRILESWHLDPEMSVGSFSAEQEEYLRFHRAEVFKE